MKVSCWDSFWSRTKWIKRLYRKTSMSGATSQFIFLLLTFCCLFTEDEIFQKLEKRGVQDLPIKIGGCHIERIVIDWNVRFCNPQTIKFKNLAFVIHINQISFLLFPYLLLSMFNTDFVFVNDLHSHIFLILVSTNSIITQPAFNSSELTIETLEQGVKYVQC